MNKSSIQKFAIWARTELIAQVSQKAYQYGITEEGYGEANAVTVGGRALSSEEAKQRRELVAQILKKGYTQVMEEVAYTWFNRFIALRFMEVNNYLPSHIRVFSDSTGAFKPEILSDALHLDLTGLDKDKIATYIESNQTEELYRYLLLTQCNTLNEALPRMFEKMGGYTELLFPNNILKADSILGRMVTDIPEEDWTDQVQIIGWLYQYYNSELKDDTFALLKKNVKITKERIPSATQLFTPDWIVRYMVENSLGRLWIEGHPDDELKSGWKYYLDEAEQEPEVQAQLDKIHAEYATLKPQDIKVIDPCMGSGHILVYAFDVLIQIYRKYGVSERDAAQSILQNNLYGLDIDDRAAQLAYFAVMMKARQYDRRIFSRGIQPHVYAIVESNGLDNATIDYFTNNDPKLKKDFGTLVDELRNAKEYGSILNISPVDFAALYARVEEVREDISLYRENVLHTIMPLIQVAEIMSQKYDVVLTNPPYMGSSSMDAQLSNFIKKHYPDSKSDLFAVFIERCGQMTERNRYQTMITQHAWMSLASYENLRKRVYRLGIINLLHLGPKAFDEVGGEMVQTVAFTLQKTFIPRRYGIYCRLIEQTSESAKQEMFLSGNNRFVSQQDSFTNIPGAPVSAYVAGNTLAEIYNKGKTIQDIGTVRIGMGTGNNDLFLKLWWEIIDNKISFSVKDISEVDKTGKKYFPYSKGGERKRWYGNHEYVVWYDEAGRRKMEETSGHRENGGAEYYFRKGITWSYSTMAAFSARIMPDGFVFDVNGSSIFVSEKFYYYVLGLLQSCVGRFIIDSIKSAFSIQAGTIRNLPVIGTPNSRIEDLVKTCIGISKADWDLSETSWDFLAHPLVLPAHAFNQSERGKTTIASAYAQWEKDCYDRFQQLKKNEKELNLIYIDIYELKDKLTPDVEDKELTVREANLKQDICSLISYAVGCLFGRYSLDVEGLAYAGGEWDASKYSTIIPDKDNIIPICDDDYFDDDITGRFVKWVEAVYGNETLEENLKFIADALGGKGTPREVIRNYFLNNFYADHCKTYQKRPIYWLFDSGKKNGFKALIYMHRYQGDLLARMRTDYVHEQQERYRTQLIHIADALEHASGSERVNLTRKQKTLQDQSLEIQKYEEKIHHLADQNISIDLDDGVKHNYALFADVLAKIK